MQNVLNIKIVTWTSRCLVPCSTSCSQASKANNEETSKLRITGPLWKESTSDRLNFPHKALVLLGIDFMSEVIDHDWVEIEPRHRYWNKIEYQQLQYWDIGDVGEILQVSFSNSIYKLIFWVFPVKFVSGECHRISFMTSQNCHWFM